MSPERAAIRFSLRGPEVLLDEAAWPTVAVFLDRFVRDLSGLGWVALRYPFLTIRVANGHAVYRVETCERGVWTGMLVESQIDGGAGSVRDTAVSADRIVSCLTGRAGPRA